MNLAGNIERYVPRHVWEQVKGLIGQDNHSDQRIYLVGGIVRDMLLGRPNFDLDLVVAGDAVALAQQMASSTQSRISTHPRFGTASLKFGNFTIDIATARNETYASPGRLPTVTPGTLNDDLSRRDFSINAMAISLAGENYGELIDPCHGIDDLLYRFIRILHPRSFCDDATRILRAIRYEQRLGFKLERETARLLKDNVSMLDTISGDRLRRELNLILREKYPEHALLRFSELGVLSQIGSPLKKGDWLLDKFPRARTLARPGQPASLYLCLLIYPLGQRELDQFLHRLNMPRKSAQLLHETLALKARLPLFGRTAMKRSEVYRLLKDYAPPAIRANAIASESEAVRHHLELFLNELRHATIHSTGNDLARLGFPPGPEVGELLQKLLEAKLDGEVQTKREEEDFALLLKTRRAKTGKAQSQNNRI